MKEDVKAVEEKRISDEAEREKVIEEVRKEIARYDGNAERATSERGRDESWTLADRHRRILAALQATPPDVGVGEARVHVLNLLGAVRELLGLLERGQGDSNAIIASSLDIAREAERFTHRPVDACDCVDVPHKCECPDCPCQSTSPDSQPSDGRVRVELDGEDQARLELIRDHEGNDLSENDKELLTRLAALTHSPIRGQK